MFSHLVNVMRTRDRAQDSSTLRNVRFHAFTSDKGSTTVGELNDNRRFNFSSSFQYGVDGVSTDAVYCWQCEVVFFATWKTFCTSSPVITPGFTKSKILDMSLVLYRRALYSSYFKLHVLRLRSLTPVTYLCKLRGFTLLSPSCNSNYLEYEKCVL